MWLVPEGCDGSLFWFCFVFVIEEVNVFTDGYIPHSICMQRICSKCSLWWVLGWKRMPLFYWCLELWSNWPDITKPISKIFSRCKCRSYDLKSMPFPTESYIIIHIVLIQPPQNIFVTHATCPLQDILPVVNIPRPKLMEILLRYMSLWSLVKGKGEGLPLSFHWPKLTGHM